MGLGLNYCSQISGNSYRNPSYIQNESREAHRVTPRPKPKSPMFSGAGRKWVLLNMFSLPEASVGLGFRGSGFGFVFAFSEALYYTFKRGTTWEGLGMYRSPNPSLHIPHIPSSPIGPLFCHEIPRRPRNTINKMRSPNKGPLKPYSSLNDELFISPHDPSCTPYIFTRGPCQETPKFWLATTNLVNHPQNSGFRVMFHFLSSEP